MAEQKSKEELRLQGEIRKGNLMIQHLKAQVGELAGANAELKAENEMLSSVLNMQQQQAQKAQEALGDAPEAAPKKNKKKK